MTRPWKHPKTGIFWLRKGVPEELRSLVGKREEKQSLRTRDPAEAKRRLIEALAKLETRWANLRAGPKALTEREAHKLAAPIYDQWLERHRDNPSGQKFWKVDLAAKLWPSYELTWDGTSLVPHKFELDFSPEAIMRSSMESWCDQLAGQCLAVHGLTVDDDSRLKLAKAMAAAVQRASLTLARFAQGDFSLSEEVDRPSTAAPPQTPSRPAEEVLPLDIVIQGWATERRPTEKTLYEWSRVLRQLAAFVGHDDAKRLTPGDLMAWKQSLVATGLRPKTIRDAKLTPARSVLGWAVANRLLPINPAERIAIDVKNRASETKRGFTEEEAAIVLKAALAAKDPVRRWIPWLCCYSGARLSEMCQLRREDIVCLEGIWVMRIDPDAGSLKTRSSERVVPLHPALIDCGFLSFVEKAKPGPLFADLPPDKFGSRGGNGTKVLGRWVRSLGLEDLRLSPNHSWRHRLKTLGRRYELAPDLVSAIVGHARKTVADAYGEYPVSALYRELCKIPPVQLSSN